VKHRRQWLGQTWTCSTRTVGAPLVRTPVEIIEIEAELQLARQKDEEDFVRSLGRGAPRLGGVSRALAAPGREVERMAQKLGSTSPAGIGQEEGSLGVNMPVSDPPLLTPAARAALEAKLNFRLLPPPDDAEPLSDCELLDLHEEDLASRMRADR
jgi:hypothetical protein